MLISWAILSRTAAVGVGFLLNSISRVTSCSCVARWRFWFFCCCVRVLFRGRRFVDCGAVAVLDVDGEGVDVEDAVAVDVAVADVVEGVSVEDMAGEMSGRGRSGVVYTGPGFVPIRATEKKKGRQFVSLEAASSAREVGQNEWKSRNGPSTRALSRVC